MRVGVRVISGLFALGASLALAQPAPESASGWRQQPALHAKQHLVVAAHPLAAEAGLRILRSGGSALDAAIATQLVLNLVEPQSSGIGGGAFLLHFSASNRSLRAYDGRETAPSAATPELFLGPDGKPMGFAQALVGGRSVGAPGLVPMLEAAHRRHGRLPWKALFDDVIRLAEQGFPISPRLHALLARDRFLRDDPNARALYYEHSGDAKAAGVLLRNPELAATMRAVATHGARALTHGPIARDIVATVRGHARNPGLLTAKDLAAYRPIERAPLCAPYRQWRVCGMPPPSSGGVTVLQMLKLLESRELNKLAPDSLLAAHMFSEAARLAYADRNAYLADPAFVPVPVRAMLAPRYLDQRAALIDPRRSMGQAEPGKLDRRATFRADSHEQPATTHLTVVDREGNVVAFTSTIESAFGARLMVRGFLLNNELTDFSFAPERDGTRVANRVEGGKRPRSSMAPTMVFDRQGRLVLTLGSPGGEWIINYVARALIAVLDWQLDVQQAFALPHVGSRNGPTELERGTAAESLQSGLELLGHNVRLLDMTSGLHGVQRTPGGWLGAADPRREGAARGD